MRLSSNAGHLSKADLRCQLAQQGVRHISRLFVLIREPDGTLSWSRRPARPATFAQLPTAGRLNPN